MLNVNILDLTQDIKRHLAIYKYFHLLWDYLTVYVTGKILLKFINFRK
jgi:hypothetical protein